MTQRRVTIGLVLTLLLGQWGCAARLTERERSQLGTIGVASARTAAATKLNPPVKGAGRGAVAGALQVFGASVLEAGPALPFGVALGIVLAPVAAFAGAVNAESASAVEQAEAALKAAFEGFSPQETLRDRVLETARKYTRHSLVALSEYPYLYPSSGSLEALEQPPVDTVLEISVVQLHLTPRGGGFTNPSTNPRYGLTMVVRTRLTRATDGSVIHAREFRYPGAKQRATQRRFVAWAREGAEPLRQELDRATAHLSAQIVHALFLE